MSQLNQRTQILTTHHPAAMPVLHPRQPAVYWQTIPNFKQFENVRFSQHDNLLGDLFAQANHADTLARQRETKPPVPHALLKIANQTQAII